MRVTDRKGSVGLPDDEAAVVDRLLAAGKPVVVACFGSPYLAERFPSAKTWIAAFSTVDVAQRAMGRALFGQTAVGGRLPVNIPGVAALGAGLDLAANPMELREADERSEAKLQRAYDVLDQAVADHAFPGGVLAVGYKDELIVHEFGRQTYDAKSPAVNVDTIYDAASLTKPVVTATLVAMQVEAGRIGLDLPVARYIPEWNDGPESRLAQDRHDPQFADAFFGTPRAQGLFPDAAFQARIHRRDLQGISRIRARDENGLLRSRLHPARRNSRARHGQNGGSTRARTNLRASRHVQHHVQSAEEFS